MKTWSKTNGLNDRSRGKDTNKPVGLQFSSISRGTARTAWPRTTSIPTANTADVIFQQMYLIIDNHIKNAFFHICVILNTVKKKMQLPSATTKGTTK